ncbi:MAG TPA: hypothetical protein VN696_05650, partial [Pyrinomonadaceae bacterium]|nr:hypothetical protein [Pyrinomonadaceae bacterium]
MFVEGSNAMILTSLLTFAAKVGLNRAKKLFEETPVQRAAAATAAEFPNCEVTLALKTWCESDNFADLLEALTRGDRPITTASIVTSFIKTTDFFNGEETDSTAESILTAFENNLTKEIYNSEEGLSTLANRLEELHVETREDRRNDLSRNNKQLAEQISATVKQDIAGLLASSDTTSSAEIQDKVFGARIGDARQLIREGRFRSARSRLETIRKEAASAESSVMSQFQIATNLALCAIQLEDLEIAKTELNVALALKPDEPEALAYAAFVAGRLGEQNRAAELLANVDLGAA